VSVVSSAVPSGAAPPVASPSGRRSWKPRIIPQWDKNPKRVEQAATLEGRLALVGLFGLLLFLGLPLTLWVWTMAVLVAASVLPAWRWNLVTVGTLGTGIYAAHARYAVGGTALRALAVWGTAWIAVVLFGVLIITVAVKWPRSSVMKRPVLSLNIFFAALAFAAAVTPLSRNIQLGVQFALVVLAGYLWYFAYSLQDRLASNRASAFHQIGTWAPFWVNASGGVLRFVRALPTCDASRRKLPRNSPSLRSKG